MIVIDASVWVSALLTTDVNHASSEPWLHQQLEDGREIMAPAILQAEVSGAVARRNRSIEDGLKALAFIEAVPRLRRNPLDEALRLESARLASTLGLRGADATYVAVAQRYGLPLITWDRDQAARARSVIMAQTPGTLTANPFAPG